MGAVMDEPLTECTRCDDWCSPGEYTDYGMTVCGRCYYALPRVVEGIEDESDYDIKKEGADDVEA
jgi:hypothetical protein